MKRRFHHAVSFFLPEKDIEIAFGDISQINLIEPLEDLPFRGSQDDITSTTPEVVPLNLPFFSHALRSPQE